MSNLLVKFFSCLPSWLFRYNQAIVFFADYPQIKIRENDNYIFGTATESDLQRVANLSGHQLSVLIDRFQNDCHCFYVADKSSNEIVAVQWGFAGKCFVRGINFSMEIKSDEVYLFGGLSSPTVRFTGIYNNLLKLVCDHYKSNNISTFYGVVETNNSLSQKYHQKINFSPTILTTYIKFLSLRISYDKNINNGNGHIGNNSKFRLLFKEPNDTFVV